MGWWPKRRTPAAGRRRTTCSGPGSGCPARPDGAPRAAASGRFGRPFLGQHAHCRAGGVGAVPVGAPGRSSRRAAARGRADPAVSPVHWLRGPGHPRGSASRPRPTDSPRGRGVGHDGHRDVVRDERRQRQRVEDLVVSEPARRRVGAPHGVDDPPDAVERTPDEDQRCLLYTSPSPRD